MEVEEGEEEGEGEEGTTDAFEKQIEALAKLSGITFSKVESGMNVDKGEAPPPRPWQPNACLSAGA